MENETCHVPGISCGHCVATIERELGGLEGVVSVRADESSKNVLVEFQAPASPAAIRSLLAEINYPADDDRQ